MISRTEFEDVKRKLDALTAIVAEMAAGAAPAVADELRRVGRPRKNAAVEGQTN